jgi:hypothetical protein
MISKEYPKSVSLCLASIFVALLPTFAQQTNVGNITGSVADASGAIIPGADVIAMNTATGVAYQTVATNAGLYNINLLPIGSYNVTVSKAGFAKETRLAGC